MLHFIVNPSSRSGLGQTIWRETEQILKNKNLEYKVHFTQYPRHATTIAADITSDGTAHTIVVLGGDGSIDEVINGIKDLSVITLGYIPLGSGNDFARGMKIPKNPQKALSRILHRHKISPVDIATFLHNEKAHRFIVSSGIGYDADICHQVSKSSIKKLLNRVKLGKFAYVALSIHSLIHCKPKKMTVVMDKTKTLHFQKAYFAAAMNLPYEGGGCKFCPSAKPDDGFLDLIIIADVSKIMALFILPTVFFGGHIHLKGVHIYRCKQAEISSEIPLPVHADGEPLEAKKHLKWFLSSSRLKVIH